MWKKIVVDVCIFCILCKNLFFFLKGLNNILISLKYRYYYFWDKKKNLNSFYKKY